MRASGVSENPSFLLRAGALFIFFFSGTAGLLYQVIWSRLLGTIFGHTVYTSASVLFCFMGGMALGYWTAGTRLQRIRSSPLFVYGILEIVIAGWAVLIPFLLHSSVAASAAAVPGGAGTFLCVLFSFVVLLPATFCLGATWPVMAAFFSQFKHPARSLSWGYATNTAGAVVGALLASSAFLVWMGVTGTGKTGAVLSALCGFAALGISRFETPRQQPTETIADVEPARLLLSWRCLVVLSGFSILALEVLYVRMFSLVFHNSAYTFGVVVAVFLMALAAGGALAGWASQRISPTVLAGLGSGYGAVGILGSLGLFVWKTEYEYFSVTGGFNSYVLSAVGLVALVAGPPIVMLGMLLPASWNALRPGPALKLQVAQLTTLSTVAGAAGALAAYFLLPALGLWPSFIFFAALFMATGLSVLMRGKMRIHGLVLIFMACGTGSFAWEKSSQITTLYRGDEMMRRWEGSYGWTDIIRLPDDSYIIRQNLHYAFGSTRFSAQRDFRQGHLPLLLHANPKHVAFLGMGIGQSASAALGHPSLISIDVCELIPEAVQAARYLKKYNRGLLDHPRVQVHVQDARKFISTNNRRLDVIVSDLFVPWESHTGYLYTQEHYRAGLNSLDENGLYCQWLPLFQLGAEEFECIAATFASVFPCVSVWWAETSEDRAVVGLIGTRKPICFDDTRAIHGWAEFDPYTHRQDSALATGAAIFELYAGDWKFDPTVKLNTDEFPRVEFSAPVSHANDRKLRRKMLHDYRERVLSKLPKAHIYRRN